MRVIPVSFCWSTILTVVEETKSFFFLTRTGTFTGSPNNIVKIERSLRDTLMNSTYPTDSSSIFVISNAWSILDFTSCTFKTQTDRHFLYISALPLCSRNTYVKTILRIAISSFAAMKKGAVRRTKSDDTEHVLNTSSPWHLTIWQPPSFYYPFSENSFDQRHWGPMTTLEPTSTNRLFGQDKALHPLAPFVFSCENEGDTKRLLQSHENTNKTMIDVEIYRLKSGLLHVAN